jgi:hypothetical protein
VQSLWEQPLITNEVIPLEDPARFTVADDRFFYLKSSGSLVALEAMNGESNLCSTINFRRQVKPEVSCRTILLHVKNHM